MRVLVTGGAGFIGCWLVRHWLNTFPDATVTNLDALTYAGNLDNLADVAESPRYRFVHGDIRDRDLVDSLMAQADWCIHAAAETHVDRSITHPDAFVETNVVGTQVLLDAARNHNLNKFVQVSTDEVYGSLSLETPEKFSEASPLVPSSPYAASKAAADLLAMSYAHTYGLPMCITRCGNNYGPYQYPEKLIPFFILKLLQGETVPLYGDGLNVRDWIHVADHAAGVVAVALRGMSGEIYNVGADNQRSNREITQLLLTLMDQPESRIQSVADRPGHDRRYALDTRKIRTQLGWQPQQTFEAGLRDTVAWYQSQTGWIRDVLARQDRDQITPGASWLVSL